MAEDGSSEQCQKIFVQLMLELANALENVVGERYTDLNPLAGLGAHCAPRLDGEAMDLLAMGQGASEVKKGSFMVEQHARAALRGA